jgi:16S rRNA (uracil1498-N3)-methyltransferase
MAASAGRLAPATPGAAPPAAVKPGCPQLAQRSIAQSMARYDFRSPRLFVAAPLAPGALLTLDRPRVHYLRNVLRLKAGDQVLVFNGQDGEWRATLSEPGRRTAALAVHEHTRAQTAPCDLHYLFAPLKHERLDYMVQKAIELGVSRLVPVITRHVQVTRVNLDRMRANAIEAAEQCGILTLAEIAGPLAFEQMVASRDPKRLLVFCDEDAEIKDPVAALSAQRANGARPLAVLIGPEGGFSDDERAALMRSPNVVRLSLGPRILRADTAAVAALALVQGVLGDWR